LARLFQSGGGGAGISGFATETISAAGTISSTSSGIQSRPVVGDGGAVTASGTPFGTSINWQNGTMIVLRGTDATNTVRIDHNDVTDGAILNGTATLGENDILSLVYDSNAERWIEVSRNF